MQAITLNSNWLQKWIILVFVLQDNAETVERPGFSDLVIEVKLQYQV